MGLPASVVTMMIWLPTQGRHGIRARLEVVLVLVLEVAVELPRQRDEHDARGPWPRRRAPMASDQATRKLPRNARMKRISDDQRSAKA